MPPMRTTVIASSFQALEYSLWGLFPEPQTVARAWSGLAVQGHVSQQLAVLGCRSSSPFP